MLLPQITCLIASDNDSQQPSCRSFDRSINRRRPYTLRCISAKADPDIQLGVTCNWGPAAKSRSGGQRDEVLLKAEDIFLTKLPHKFGKFRLHGERESASVRAYNRSVGHRPSLHTYTFTIGLGRHPLHIN